MHTIKKGLFLIITLWLAIGYSVARNKDREGYKFELIKEIAHTSVKNQYKTSTCWSFSGTSFFEAEMLRMGKPEVDLSEMFLVSMCYRDKALRYVRMHGNTNFGPGGVFFDDLYVADNYGLIPENVFPGTRKGEGKPAHGEMDNELRKMVEGIVENKNNQLSSFWNDSVNKTIDNYLGDVPQNFEYKGVNYTPKSFAADYCGIKGDDYIQITSFSHHPFYQPFVLEVPDNWLWSEFYNVPIDELQEIADSSLLKGYSVLWAADTSEKGFASTEQGIAVIPDNAPDNLNETEMAQWNSLPEKEKKPGSYKFNKPGKEKVITQENRQIAFNNQETTDDHAMHLVGLARDQNGKVYYKVKNSWGKYNHLKGYFYASPSYLRYKTTAILVNKAAIPLAIRKKLQL